MLEDNLWKEVHKSIDISEKITREDVMTANGMEALTVLSLMEIASEIKEIRSILGGNNETKS